MLLLFVFISVVCTLPDRQNLYLCNSLWFIFMYLFIGWFKLYRYKNLRGGYGLHRKWLYLIVGVGIYLILSIALYIVRNNIGLTNVVLQYLEDIKTIPNWISAFCIFLFVLNIKEHNSKTINFIARTTFGVYIIHQVPAFINLLMKDICKVNTCYTLNGMILYGIISAVLMYICFSVIDNIRIVFLEPKWEKSKLFNKISNKIDNFYSILE